jgi:hypothetical protein
MADEKLLDVTDPRRRPYKRVIRTHPVTFTCAECGQDVTEELYPGAAPRYCNDCLREVHRRKNAERQRAWRERQRKRR